VGLLSWLGFQRESSFPNLESLLRELRKALPDVVLLGKVACVDGRFSAKEEELLRALLAHVEGLEQGGIEAVCTALQGKLPSIQEQELDRCYRELKALCDADERARVVRLLVQLAAADGAPSAAERAEIEHIAEELGVPLSELAPDAEAG
jgi:DnaJ like chaperone protein